MNRLGSDGLSVLVLTPVGRDGSASAEVIRRAGIEAEVCADLAELIQGLKAGAGAVLLAEEALFGKSLNELAAWVAQQPPWSDLPFILLACGTSEPAIFSWRQRLILLLRNVTLLDRPVWKITLASSLQSAVRARRHQYKIRLHLANSEATTEILEVLVATRTSELEEVNRELHSEIMRREEVETILRQSQKMEALGQLTGGIAHDFNNMLQVIRGGLELVADRIEQGRTSGVPHLLKTMTQSADRAAALINRLLAFARQQPLQPQIISPRILIASMEPMFLRVLGPAVTVELPTHDGAWAAYCDPNQLENALLNLAINARDAMPDGGSVRVAIEDVRLTEGQAAAHEGAASGCYVKISVTDTGSGMDQAIQARVFEPFFTTKPVGQGTGLGLSQVYGFVRQSKGFVQLHSKLGEGTTISLFLSRHGAADPLQVESEIGSDAVVVLVEHDLGVRLVVAEWLNQAGYRVLEAKDGPTALQLLAEKSRVDVLVTDVGLPNGPNGRQIADAARETRPDLPVLFMTGYSGSRLVEPLAPQMYLMDKPFSLATISGRISDILAPKQASMGTQPDPNRFRIEIEGWLRQARCDENYTR